MNSASASSNSITPDITAYFAKSPVTPCPTCGHCPTCGRHGLTPQPVPMPTYPQPYPPWYVPLSPFTWSQVPEATVIS